MLPLLHQKSHCSSLSVCLPPPQKTSFFVASGPQLNHKFSPPWGHFTSHHHPHKHKTLSTQKKTKKIKDLTHVKHGIASVLAGQRRGSVNALATTSTLPPMVACHASPSLWSVTPLSWPRVCWTTADRAPAGDRGRAATDGGGAVCRGWTARPLTTVDHASINQLGVKVLRPCIC